MSNAVSHDQNFKNLIVEYPRDALALFAADEAPGAEDATKVIPLRQEQLKERLGDRFRALDTPLLVEWPDGRREAVLFVLEAESDDRKFSIHRLAQYCLDLAVMLDTDRVVPVTIFLRGARAAPASLVLGTELRPYLTFEHLACALGEMPAERWLDSDNLVARLNLPNMRSPAARKLDVYGHAVRGLLDLEPDPGLREKYLKFIDTYAELTENELERYRKGTPRGGQNRGGTHTKGPRRELAGGHAARHAGGNPARHAGRPGAGSRRGRANRSGTTAAAAIRSPVARSRRTTRRGTRGGHRGVVRQRARRGDA